MKAVGCRAPAAVTALCIEHDFCITHLASQRAHNESMLGRTSHSDRSALVKAILCTRFGGPDDLVLADLPNPVAGAGEVVVKIAAVGLNFFDTLIIAGKYQRKPPFPFSPGGEFTGMVESVGTGVTAFATGDRVLGYTTFGAARERLAAAADDLVKLAADFDLVRAAALAITYGTAYHALNDRARLKGGETLAVLGAAGGVGLAAVEVGKRLGARLIACASTADKLAFARAHGADDAVNYTTEDLREALKRLGGEHGIDVIFDPIGGPTAKPRCGRSPGRVGISSSASPQARSRSCRSISLCSRAATCSASISATGSGATAMAIAPRSAASPTGPRKACCRATSTAPTRSPTCPRRSRR